MRIKLFSRSKTVTRDDMRTPDPTRTPTDFSDPAYQQEVNHSAGYQKAGSSAKSQDGTLVMDADENYLYRHQNGILWRKRK